MGPTGIGALYALDPALLQPLVGGGDQEQGLRGGTENLIGAVGFGAAAEERMRTFTSATALIEVCRDSFEQAVLAAEPRLAGEWRPRTPRREHVQSAVPRHRRHHARGRARRARDLLLAEFGVHDGAADAVARTHGDGAYRIRSVRFAPVLFRCFSIPSRKHSGQPSRVVESYRDLIERLHRLGVA